MSDVKISVMFILSIHYFNKKWLKKGKQTVLILSSSNAKTRSKSFTCVVQLRPIAFLMQFITLVKLEVGHDS